MGHLRGALTGCCLLASLTLAQSAEEIILGESVPLTGRQAAIGKDLRDGRLACIKYVNAHSSNPERIFRLETLDDQGEPAAAVANARTLVASRGASLLLGSVGPSVNQAVNAWAEGEAVAVVDPYGGDIETRQAHSSTAFYVTANKSAEAQRLVSHVISLGLKRIAIAYVTEQGGQASLVAFEEALSVADLAPAAEILVAGNGSNARDVVASLEALKPQAVLLATSGSATLEILKGLPRDPASGLMQVYGLSSTASQSELRSIGAGT